MDMRILVARVAPVQRVGDWGPRRRGREAARRAAAVMNRDSKTFANILASAIADHS